MDSFEWNKIFAAVITGALLIMVINTVTETLFHHEEAEKPAYTIEVAAAESGATDTAVEEGPSLAELMQTASVEKGARQFGKCRSCHTVENGGGDRTGPNLYGIVGKSIASSDGYAYSAALASHGGTWTYEMIDAWLANPKAAIAGNKMSFPGIRRPEQRADLIAYLRSFADSPVPLPEMAVIEETVEEAADKIEDAVADTASH